MKISYADAMRTLERAMSTGLAADMTDAERDALRATVQPGAMFARGAMETYYGDGMVNCPAVAAGLWTGDDDMSEPVFSFACRWDEYTREFMGRRYDAVVEVTA